MISLTFLDLTWENTMTFNSDVDIDALIQMDELDRGSYPDVPQCYFDMSDAMDVIHIFGNFLKEDS